jgi:hypothetical protein
MEWWYSWVVGLRVSRSLRTPPNDEIRASVQKPLLIAGMLVSARQPSISIALDFPSVITNN